MHMYKHNYKTKWNKPSEQDRHLYPLKTKIKNPYLYV